MNKSNKSRIVAFVCLLFVLFAAAVSANELAKFEQVYALKEDFERSKNELAKIASVRAFYSHLEYKKLSEIATKGKKSDQTWAKARLNALKDYEKYDFVSFYDLPQLDEQPSAVSNLYEVLNGLSQIRLLEKSIKSYQDALKNAGELSLLSDKEYSQAKELNKLGELDNVHLEDIKQLAETFRQGAFALANANELFNDKAKAQIKTLKKQIQQQYASAGVYLAVVLAIIAIRILLARIIRAAVVNKDKLYSITKILNIFTTFIIILFSVFYFVENISYLISVLGFASAGLAIAMKDMFMSLLGWCVLQFGGGFHVGDRVRVSKDGSVYVGDIVDISLLKMTIYEDVTLTTYMQNRRAGRLVYIPNNYIFTDLLANYNYSALKSVWDGIDITFSFDSDIDLAREIMLNTATEHSSALASQAKAAISKMRNHYSMRSSGTDAKIFTLIEPYGVRLSVWFMAPSRETLKARSVISAAIIAKITAEPRVKIAYPTQTLYKKEIE